MVDQVRERLGSEYSPYVTDHIEEVDGELCWLVTVTRSAVPVFVHWKGDTSFFVREGPRTSELDSESAWRYIKNHWR